MMFCSVLVVLVSSTGGKGITAPCGSSHTDGEKSKGGPYDATLPQLGPSGANRARHGGPVTVVCLGNGASAQLGVRMAVGTC